MITEPQYRALKAALAGKVYHKRNGHGHPLIHSGTARYLLRKRFVFTDAHGIERWFVVTDAGRAAVAEWEAAQ